MKTTTLFPAAVLAASVASLAACTPLSDVNAPPGPSGDSSSSAGETSSFQITGPQSYTPDTKPKGRDRAIRQLWTTALGSGTDHRTTMAFADGSIWIGTKRTAAVATKGKGGASAAGIYAIDGRTGARRTMVPPSQALGDIVGIAIEGSSVYASSSSGEIIAITKQGKPLFRANIGAAAVTPPTILDVDNDGVADIAVGDAKGKITVLDGKTGKARWSSQVAAQPGIVPESRQRIGSGLAAADLDGDGIKEIVGGTEYGELVALNAKTGQPLWRLARPSALRAAPVISDVDADKKLEVIVGWADGDVAIVDGKSGQEIWNAHVEEDDGDPTGLLASPTPMPGGSILVPTARWGKEDSVVLLRAHERAYRSKQGAVVASPILATVQPGTTLVDAVVGTTSGDVIAFDAAGGMAFLYHLDGPIEAPALIADIEGNGLQELVVVTREGKMTALAIHATISPVLSRARGNASTNDGVVAPIDLGWRLP